ncbi:hypothetical protein ACFKAH_002978 [Vibrio parahaemolyticus]|nr:hypothetical protein [Vibrio parahaemolyticus]MCS0328238.1 hypothetical protein [Vibrio diabolicus]MCS0405172.1 hypothetical protein [Vibrio diabolicus]
MAVSIFIGKCKSSGEEVLISNALRGMKCNCVCFNCGGDLVANKGKIKAHHFSHKGNLDRNCGESTLHKVAKHILFSKKDLSLFTLTKKLHHNLKHPKPSEKTLENAKLNLSSFKVEDRQQGIISDASCMAEFNGASFPINFEIVYSNKIDKRKYKKIKNRDITTIEINLNKIQNELKDSSNIGLNLIIDNVLNEFNYKIIHISKDVISLYLKFHSNDKLSSLFSSYEKLLSLKIEERFKAKNIGVINYLKLYGFVNDKFKSLIYSEFNSENLRLNCFDLNKHSFFVDNGNVDLLYSESPLNEKDKVFYFNEDGVYSNYCQNNERTVIKDSIQREHYDDKISNLTQYLTGISIFKKKEIEKLRSESMKISDKELQNKINNYLDKISGFYISRIEVSGLCTRFKDFNVEIKNSKTDDKYSYTFNYKSYCDGSIFYLDPVKVLEYKNDSNIQDLIVWHQFSLSKIKERINRRIDEDTNAVSRGYIGNNQNQPSENSKYNRDLSNILNDFINRTNSIYHSKPLAFPKNHTDGFYRIRNKHNSTYNVIFRTIPDYAKEYISKFSESYSRDKCKFLSIELGELDHTIKFLVNGKKREYPLSIINDAYNEANLPESKGIQFCIFTKDLYTKGFEQSLMVTLTEKVRNICETMELEAATKKAQV